MNYLNWYLVLKSGALVCVFGFALDALDAFVELLCSIQGLQTSNWRHPAKAGSLYEDVRWICEELRPSHGLGQHLDTAVLAVQERRPEHTSRTSTWRFDLAKLFKSCPRNESVLISASVFWMIRNRMCVGTWRCSTTCWSPFSGFLATSSCSKTTWRSCQKTLWTGRMQRVRP